MPVPFFCKLPPQTPVAILAAAFLSAAFTPACLAQTPPSSPAEADALVRRAVGERLAEDANHRPLRYLFHKQDDRHDILQDIIETSQGDVALIVASNGHLLGPVARQDQINRLNTLAANPAMQQHRQKHEQEDQARVDKLLRLLPDAFLYRYVGTDRCAVTSTPNVEIPGEPAPSPAPEPALTCWHLTFTPNPNWNPPDFESQILRGMAGDIWMEPSQDRLVRLSAHLVTSVNFGWGILGRLDKGGTVFLEQSYVDGGEWELTRMKLNLTGKALMVKPLAFHISDEMARFSAVPPSLDYRQAIRMLLASQPPAAK